MPYSIDAVAEKIAKSSSGVRSVTMWRSALTRKVEALNRTIAEATQELEDVSSELSMANTGLLWAKTKMLADVGEIIQNLPEPHRIVFAALQEHLDWVHAPMNASDLKAKVSGRVTDMSLTAVIQQLIEARLVLRGGPESAAARRGKLWTLPFDLNQDIQDMERELKEVSDVVGEALDDRAADIVELWPDA